MFSGKKLKTPEDFLNSSDIKNQRRGFRTGLESNDINLKSRISVEQFKALNKRRGMGNIRLTRPAFKQSAPKPRKVDFDMPKPKFEIGEETLNKIFNIKEKDPTDKEWLRQYNEIKRMYPDYTDEQIESLIGRPQRVIDKRVNFAQGIRSLEDELKLMKNALLQGLETNKDLVEMKLVELLGQNSTIEKLEDDIELLRECIAQAQETGRDDTYHELSLPMIVDKATFINLKSIVLYYILTKSKEVFDKQMDRVNVRGIGGKYLKLSSLIKVMESKDTNLELDLETLSLRPAGQYVDYNKEEITEGLSNLGRRYRQEEKYDTEDEDDEDWTDEGEGEDDE